MKNLEEIKRLLDILHENPEFTQRDLVGQLDVSLGKVNFLISALSKKGLIKLERFKKSHRKLGYLYLITPSGIAEKARLTMAFLRSKQEEYDRLKNEIEQLQNEIAKNN